MNAIQYLTDEEGHKTAVVLPLQDFEDMMDQSQLARIARESEDEPTRPLADVIEELRAAGKLEGWNV